MLLPVPRNIPFTFHLTDTHTCSQLTDWTPTHSPITLPLSHLSPTPLFSPIITPLTTQASNGVDGVMFIVFLTYTMIPFSLRVSTLLCTLLSVAHIIISAVVAITLHIQLELQSSSGRLVCIAASFLCVQLLQCLFCRIWHAINVQHSLLHPFH